MVSAINPALLWGTLLIAGPIIIHLLNRRRYRTVLWAAMDLLLAAERQNRRRIRLEHLILLALRCLAVLLIALVVARLVFDWRGLGLGALGGVRIERVVILDDSPSMSARRDNRPVFHRARKALVDFVRQLASDRPGDSLTVILTSQPQRPWLRGKILTPERIEALTRSLEALEPSSMAARFEKSLLTAEELGREADDAGNRAVYVISDFRRFDWQPPEGTPQGGGVAGHVARLSATVEEVVLVDVGDDDPANVGVIGMAPADKTLVAGVPVEFNVRVRNFGALDVSGVQLSLAAGESVAQRQEIANLAPGETATVGFMTTLSEAGSVALHAGIDTDRLAAADRYTYAAEVRAGVRVLVVNGEPRAEESLNESFYLALALAPPGERNSGFAVRTLTEEEFESTPLDNVQAIFLCNPSRLNEERAKSLAEWVVGGGGLVIFPGDQFDPLNWNEEVSAAAEELVPARAGELAGDETEQTWAGVRVGAATHPVLRGFAGEQNPLLQRVKVFRWWRLEPAEDASVPMRFDNGDPALVERSAGKGRVLLFATTADAEWGNWPSDPSYVIIAQELGRYAARPSLGERNLQAGESLRLPVDPARYATEAVLHAPGRESGEHLRAAPLGKGLGFIHPSLDRAGTYALELRSLEGHAERRYIAVNPPPGEGNLHKMPAAELKALLGEARVRFATGDLVNAEGDPSRGEIWRPLLMLLLAVLCAEQALAWWFGRRREGEPA